MTFAVDQQPFLQGYLAVMSLALKRDIGSALRRDSAG
jgi:hypothetical protein